MAPQQSTAQLKTAPGEELQRWIRDRASFQPGDLLGREWRFRQLRVLVIRAEQVRDVAHPLVEDRPILGATGIEHGRARPVLRDQRAELGVVDAGEVLGEGPSDALRERQRRSRQAVSVRSGWAAAAVVVAATVVVAAAVAARPMGLPARASQATQVVCRR